jgi:hypothetical protein
MNSMHDVMKVSDYFAIGQETLGMEDKSVEEVLGQSKEEKSDECC